MNRLREQIEQLELQKKVEEHQEKKRKKMFTLPYIRERIKERSKRMRRKWEKAKRLLKNKWHTALYELKRYIRYWKRKWFSDVSATDRTVESVFSRTVLPSYEEIVRMREKQKSKRNVILWDVENISYRYIDEVLYHADEPSDIVLISAKPLGEKMTYHLFPYMLLYGIKVYTDHDDSDARLVEFLYRHYREYKKVTIVSSDTDFVNPIKEVLGRKKPVRVIVMDSQKKGMIMRLKLDRRGLDIRTIKRKKR